MISIGYESLCRRQPFQACEAGRLKGPPVSHAATDNETDWAEQAKAELKRRDVSYRELAEKPTALGIHETERNIANKIGRGGFTAAFLIQCLHAIGCATLRLEDA
ncbi:hypothetical protein D3874_20605 [Oleomonas cavernae]|uniref:DUF6471 domain-containing protein n=1 Tax=Oleomonas cavernae TaxID=2320859 RepID=A0A418WGG7_9PROT|nr:hypothetical protein D3874_20605 [Oleomonas cavernae]